MTLTVRLPETVESQLTRFCESTGVSKSQVVLGALKDWFAKPVVNQSHPLLAFAEASVNAAPSPNWAGPYTKERLRERVVAGGAAHRVAESVAPYRVDGNKLAAPQKLVKRTIKGRATKDTYQRKTDAS